MAIQLNPAQLKAVYAKDPKILVVAPPGSGKTRVMCTALQEYQAAHPNHSITAITYTKKAATELAERIHNPKVKTGTIHSWALSQLYRLGNKYSFAVELLEEEEMRRIMQKIANSRGMKYVNIYQLYNYITGNIKTLDLDEQIVIKYEKVKNLYIDYKTTRGLYDFTDLPQYLLDKLEEYDEEIYEIDGLFVDEFQDIDEIQYQVFKKVNASKKFFIGDFRQAIYGFNGALEDVFARLAADNFKTYSLDTNYRSKQLILDVADSVRNMGTHATRTITDVCDIDYSDIICDRGNGGDVYFITKKMQCICFGETNMYAPKQLIKNILERNDTMILCRSNKQVRKLQALGIENCSTVHQAKGLEYTNVILVDMQMPNTEELNIAYVGMTRAKDTLCVINFEVLLEIINTIGKTIKKPVENLLF